MMDAAAFKEKYLPYHQKLYRIAFRLVEDSFDAEDIVQETYIKLWNKRDELSHVDNVESYCIVILRNLCLDFLRSKSRHQMQAADDLQISEERVLSDEIEYRDDLKQVGRILEKLPEQQRQVFKLRHFEDYSNEEIEQMTGLTAANTRVLLSRARKKIKELFYTQSL